MITGDELEFADLIAAQFQRQLKGPTEGSISVPADDLRVLLDAYSELRKQRAGAQ